MVYRDALKAEAKKRNGELNPIVYIATYTHTTRAMPLVKRPSHKNKGVDHVVMAVAYQK